MKISTCNPCYTFADENALCSRFRVYASWPVIPFYMKTKGMRSSCKQMTHILPDTAHGASSGRSAAFKYTSQKMSTQQQQRCEHATMGLYIAHDVQLAYYSRKEKKRKYYTFRHQFNEKPSIAHYSTQTIQLP